MRKGRDILCYFKKSQNGLIIIILTACVWAIYYPVLGYQFINLDDGGYVYHNLEIQGPITWKKIVWAFTTFQMANWHPLTWLSYMIDYQFYGIHPGGYHFTNVLFHVVNTCLVFMIFNKMTNGYWTSFFVALLFGIHPTHVESVVWIAERKDVLSAFGGILSIGAYWYYLQAPSAIRYVLIILFFVISLLAKPMMVTLPFIFLLLDYWPLGRLKLRRYAVSVHHGITQKTMPYLLWEKVPFFILSGLSSIITFYAQSSFGAVNESITIYSRIMNAAVSYFRYLLNVWYPMNLSVYYPYVREYPISMILIALGTILILSLWIISISIKHPYLFVGWFWFLGTLIPVIGLVQVGYQAMADRYTYIPYLGTFIMLAWGGGYIIQKRPKLRNGVIISSIFFILFIGGLCKRQISYWTDSVTLYKHALKVSPENYKIHDLLGFSLKEEGKLEDAERHFRKAIQLQPKYGSAYNNLGIIYEKKGMKDKALDYYTEAVMVQPSFAPAHYNLGVILYEKGLINKAMDHFQKCIEINRYYAEAYNNLGVIYLNKGKINLAIEQLRMAIKIKPTYADAYYNMGNAMVCAGKIEEGARMYKEALRIYPRHEKALNNLAIVERTKKPYVIELFRKALMHGRDPLLTT